MLDPALKPLFRLQNVATRRRDRISSDEEERLRMGYDLRTAIRFDDHDAHSSCRTAEVESGAEKLASLTYAHSSLIWRINLGWRRRKNKEQYGFMLDTERGYWQKSDQDVANDNDDEPFSNRTMRVIPYVEDRRNALIYQPVTPLSETQMASLQAALKNAIQVHYQLEDRELSAEPLPSNNNRLQILFYEAAEGGAGVLRCLVDEPQDLAQVARRALEICHYDPDSGSDLGHAPSAKENCEAACYNCLMSYYNQSEHNILDRKEIVQHLQRLATSHVIGAPAAISRSAQLEILLRIAESELERRWLQFLESHDCHLPTRAQILIPQCNTRPDFIYDDAQAVVYVDGPPHDFPERCRRDLDQTESMEDRGYLVIRFSHHDYWDEVVARYPHIFGRRI
jgi:very-short-patch-repair endonuclease